MSRLIVFPFEYDSLGICRHVGTIEYTMGSVHYNNGILAGSLGMEGYNEFKENTRNEISKDFPFVKDTVGIYNYSPIYNLYVVCYDYNKFDKKGVLKCIFNDINFDIKLSMRVLETGNNIISENHYPDAWLL